MRVGILGGIGFLGSEIYKVLCSKFDVYVIDRKNYNNMRYIRFDIFINSNGNSIKYIANKSPAYNFDASVRTTHNTIFDFKFNKYIYISSSDVYSYIYSDEQDSIDFNKLDNYGFSKYLSELIIGKYCINYLILRCSAIVGKNMKKGVIFDYKNNLPLYVTRDSHLQFISNTEIACIIMYLIENDFNREIINIGGIGTISVDSLENATFRESAVIEEHGMVVSKLYKIYPDLRRSSEYVEEVL